MSGQITVLGLGPGDSRQRTLQAADALALSPRIILRTGVHPGVEEHLNDPRVSTCDDLYATGSSFEEVYDQIVERVVLASSESDLVYAVPGHPLMGEATVLRLLDVARNRGIDVRLIPGISALDVVSTSLGVDLMANQTQLIDATELERFISTEPFNGALPEVSPIRPVLVTQVYSGAIASAAKLALGRVFPDTHPIIVISSAGIPREERLVTCKLFELDRQPVDHLMSVYLEPRVGLEATSWPLTLHRIAARLRAPEGCPWDREQTHASLRRTVIEEAYEVVDAIDDGDSDHLAEELGDLLLHVAMQAQIAEESGEFSIGDVYDHVNRKLVRRHPHVFGDVSASTPADVVRTWEAVKAEERGADLEQSLVDPIDRLPRSMSFSQKVAKLAGKQEALRDSRNASGDDLLRIIESLARSGYDPEKELERAYRTRSETDQKKHEGAQSA